jgi:hypothetical protein
MKPLPRDPEPGAILDWRGFRKSLYATVVSTDMSLHFSWIKEFRLLGKRLRESDAELAVEDEVNGVDLLPTEDENRIMICQAIIKCADISNPVRLLGRPCLQVDRFHLTARTCSQQTRPIDVSEHWSSVLLQEWAIQARLEQRLSLPVSVISSADAALQARGQIGFIDLFTAPLFEAATEAMPREQRIKPPTQYSHTSLTNAHFLSALQRFSAQCATNRALWQARLEAAQMASETSESAAPASLPVQPAPLVRTLSENDADERFKTLFPLSLPASLLRQQSVMGAAETLETSYIPQSPAQALPGSPASSTSIGSRYQQSTRDPANQAVRAVYRTSIRRQTSGYMRQEERRTTSALASPVV